MSDKIYNVLFLCNGNSARSIMAEAILKRLGKGRFAAHSAGARPVGRVNPHALALLEAQEHGVDGLRSKSLGEFEAAGMPEMDFIFTVCDQAAEACPIWPGHPMTAHWGMEDPAAAKGSEAEIGLAFSQAYRALWNRISLFVNLPLASIDRMALGRKLRDIGAA